MKEAGYRIGQYALCCELCHSSPRHTTEAISTDAYLTVDMGHAIVTVYASKWRVAASLPAPSVYPSSMRE
jgi:hypothetical protein